MIDFIMRLFGYENIDRIHICDDFKNKPPKKDKMDFRRYYYNVRKKFWVPIVVKKNIYGITFGCVAVYYA